MQPETTPRGEILLEAKQLIEGDRNVSYGSPTQNFANTAALLNVQFGHKLSEPFTAADVAVIMMQLKLARLIASPKRDTWTDIAGYAACGYEASLPPDLADHPMSFMCCNRPLSKHPEGGVPGRVRREWAPESVEPTDVFAVKSLQNKVIFKALGNARPTRNWVATTDSGGDGAWYRWADINHDSGSSGEGMHVVEVFPEELT